MRKILVSGMAALAVATFSLVRMASAWAAGDCGWGSHATRTASTSIDTIIAPRTSVEQPKSGG